MPVVDREQEQGAVDGKPRDHLLDELRRIRRAHDDLRAPELECGEEPLPS